MDYHYLGGSFRDPSGRVFTRDHSVLREVNKCYELEYQLLMSSGLFIALTDSRQLVFHKELPLSSNEPPNIFRIIEPEFIPFISYPYEWCFSQLKDAALLTLEIQKKSLEYGMTLKDASAYNVQFQGCNPIFIDTLSFAIYEEGKPWVAYRQFCQHFLAPLLLCAYCDIRLSRLLQIYLDGIPLDLASKMLPKKTRLIPGILMHIHMHSKYQQKYSKVNAENKKGHKAFVSKKALLGIIESLEAIIKKTSWQPTGTEWAEYYTEGENNYTEQALLIKRDIIYKYIERVKPKNIWDLGANNGFFSRVASEQGIVTVSMDIDPAAVEINYLTGKKDQDSMIHPLLIDVTDPTPSKGWNLKERMSLIERGPAHLVMALALIHHLVIGNNVPFDEVAQFLASLCQYLIIEFVPKNDSQVRNMLSCREDIFDNYDIENFIMVFNKYFDILDETLVTESLRTVFLMKVKGL